MAGRMLLPECYRSDPERLRFLPGSCQALVAPCCCGVLQHGLQVQPGRLTSPGACTCFVGLYLISRKRESSPASAPQLSWSCP